MGYKNKTYPRTPFCNLKSVIRKDFGLHRFSIGTPHFDSQIGELKECDFTVFKELSTVNLSLLKITTLVSIRCVPKTYPHKGLFHYKIEHLIVMIDMNTHKLC